MFCFVNIHLWGQGQGLTPQVLWKTSGSMEDMFISVSQMGLGTLAQGRAMHGGL